MLPSELTQLLIGLNSAADIVEAIDDPELQQKRGWDLSQWRYDLVPWGVRFRYKDVQQRPVEVLAMLGFERGRSVPGCVERRTSTRESEAAGPEQHTTVLLFR
jgi:hypothetical protein